MQVDVAYVVLKQTVSKKSWKEASKEVKAFSPLRHHLTLYKDLVLFGDRIVIPHKARSEVLNLLHAQHCSIEKTKRRARNFVYWPGLAADRKLRQEVP